MPYDHVTEFVVVRAGRTRVQIYGADLRVIAEHELFPRGAGERRRLEGRTYPGRRHRPLDVDALRPVFTGLGEPASRFFEAMVNAQPRSAGYHGRSILALRDRYSTTDIIKAMDHAYAYGAYDHRAVARIVITRGTPRRFDEYVNEATTKKMENRAIVQKCATQPRELETYDTLALGQSEDEENGPQCQNQDKHTRTKNNPLE